MHLRSSSVLKFFAILLFSFELIAPAIVQPEGEREFSPQVVSLSTLHHAPNLLNLLVFETSEELESKGHKGLFLLAEFGFNIGFIELRENRTIKPKRSDREQQYDTRPSRYTLFSTYLI